MNTFLAACPTPAAADSLRSVASLPRLRAAEPHVGRFVARSIQSKWVYNETNATISFLVLKTEAQW